MTGQLRTVALQPGHRILITDQTEYASAGQLASADNLRPAPKPRLRSWQNAGGEPCGIHAATVEAVDPVTVDGRRRYTVRTNLGPVRNVTGGQAFRPAPDGMKDSAVIRAECAADREQREQRNAEAVIAWQRRIADSDTKAERDRADARRFLAETAPEPASDAPSDRIRIERHSGSVTQREVSVFLDGDLLGRYRDEVVICTTGSNGRDPHPHPDGAVCFGGYHGRPDTYWYEVGNRVAARRELAEPVYIPRRCADAVYHRLTTATDPSTGCGRTRFSGSIIGRADAVATYAARPCELDGCYPPSVPAAPFVSPWALVDLEECS